MVHDLKTIHKNNLEADYLSTDKILAKLCRKILNKVLFNISTNNGNSFDFYVLNLAVENGLTINEVEYDPNLHKDIVGDLDIGQKVYLLYERH